MIIALEEARHELISYREKIVELGNALRIEAEKTELEELEKLTLADNFWGDQENSGKVLQSIKRKKDKIEAYEALCVKLEDAITLAEMAIEENDEGFVDEVQSELAGIVEEEEKRRIEALLSGEYDRNNAIL
ncbi:MAG: PCRF domain-containing protein, partial [Clostridia bacterium]|nr:PCRF domain-containing protein [Clostridia bacterium]